MKEPISVNLAGFDSQQIAVKPATFFQGPKFIVNGSVIKPIKGNYVLKNDAGADVTVRLLYYFIDPIPKLKVDGTVVPIAPSLKWYQYVWAAFPLLYVINGGALGAMVGIFALQSNAVIFRSERAMPMKYALTLAISVGGLAFFFLIVVILQAIISVT